MTRLPPYDGRGSLSGPVASSDWINDGFEAWRQRLATAGGKARPAVGFPGYCYTYKGASGAGDRYSAGDEVQLADVDQSQLVQQPDGSSAAQTPDGWMSCFTADDVRGVLQSLGSGQVPVFAWSAEGVTDDYLQALAGRGR